MDRFGAVLDRGSFLEVARDSLADEAFQFIHLLPTAADAQGPCTCHELQKRLPLTKG